MKAGAELTEVENEIGAVIDDIKKCIITDFLESSTPEETGEGPQYTFAQKFRMVRGAVLFCWFIPGRKRRKEG